MRLLVIGAITGIESVFRSTTKRFPNLIKLKYGDGENSSALIHTLLRSFDIIRGLRKYGIPICFTILINLTILSRKPMERFVIIRWCASLKSCRPNTICDSFVLLVQSITISSKIPQDYSWKNILSWKKNYFSHEFISDNFIFNGIK